MASTYELIVKAVDQTSGPLSKIERNLKGLNTQTGKTNKGMKTLGGNTGGVTNKLGGMSTALKVGAVGFTAAAAGATLLGKAMIDSAKQMETIENQLRLVTNGQTDLAETQLRLTKLARQNRTTLAPTVELYTRLKVATEELGFSNERVEGLTTKLSQALVVSGADASTAAGVVKQFGQAMASGTVRGDEFNSIVDGMGQALAIMAQESGISVGQLRDMSQAGELTAERFSELLENSNALTASFEKMETPLATLESQLSEAFTTYLSDLAKATKVTAGYRLILEGMIGILDKQNEATLAAATPLGALQIELVKTKQRLSELEAESVNMAAGSAAMRDGFGLMSEGADRLGDSIVQLDTPVSVLTAAIEEQKAAVVDVTNRIGEQIKAELAASIAAQQTAAATELAVKAEKERQAAIESALSVLKDQNSLVSRLSSSYAETLKPAEQFNYQIQQNKNTIDLLNTTLSSNTQMTDEQRTAYEQSIAVLVFRNAELAKERDLLGQITPKVDEYQQYLSSLTTQASENARMIEFQVRALADVEREFLAGRMSIDAYAQAMLILKGNTEEANEALNKSAPFVSEFDKFMTNLVKSSRDAAEQINYKAQAVSVLDQMLRDGKINIDTYAQAMLQIRDNAKLTGDELEKTAPKISEFAQFMTQLNERAGAAATRITHEAMAVKALNDQLAAGKISVDAYAQAMLLIGQPGSKPKPDKPTKPRELTTSEQLVKTYSDQNKKLTELKGALANVSTLAQAAGVSQEFLTQKITEQMVALDVYKEKALTVSDIMKDGFTAAAKTLSTELATAIRKGESVFDTLKNSFSRMLDNILQQILESQISSALAGLLGGVGGGGGGGGLGGMLMGMFGTPTVGAPMGGFKIPFLANGGVANAGQPHIVGERGPELFMPSRTGRVVSNDELNTGGDSPVINFNINAIDTQTGTQFLLENKQKIIGMVSTGFNQRGRQGITS